MSKLRDDLTGKMVRSIAVGRKLAFVGVVVGLHPRSSWTVRDILDGTEWCRDRSELTVLAEPYARAA